MTEHESEGRTEAEEFSRHIGWRSWTMVVLVPAWMLWLPIWWFRWGADLATSQRMAIVMLSILLFLIVLFGLWVPWSMRHGDPAERRIWENSRYWSRFWINTVGCFGCMVFITYCLWRYDWEEGEVWMVSVLILFALLAYVGLAVGPAQRLYKEEMEE